MDRYGSVSGGRAGPEVLEREPLRPLEAPDRAEACVRTRQSGSTISTPIIARSLAGAPAASAERPESSRRPAPEAASAAASGWPCAGAGRLRDPPADRRRPAGAAGRRHRRRPPPRSCSRAAQPDADRALRQAGDWVRVHAAAGGVGSILVPWLKAVGAKVIAHAAGGESVDRGGARRRPCPELPARRARGGGAKPHRQRAAVLDGAASWAASLASLAKRGLMVSYGNAWCRR